MKKLFLLAFLAFAGTSALAQTSIQGREVDARAFGAKCDASTNDTTAIAAAITAVTSTGGIVDLPDGTCVVTGLTVPGGVWLRGKGKFTSIIKSATNGVILDLVDGSGDFDFLGPKITDLWVDGSDSGSSQVGIRATHVSGFRDVVIENVTISDCGSHGLSLGNVFSSEFKNIYSTSNVGYNFFYLAPNMPSNYFYGLYSGDVSAAAPAGYRVKQGDFTCWSCNGVNVVPATAYWAVIGGWPGDIDGDVGQFFASAKFTDCNIEGAPTAGIFSYPGSGATVDGISKFVGLSASSGSWVAMLFDTDASLTPQNAKRWYIEDTVVFANSPASFYANSQPIRADGLPPLSVNGRGPQIAGGGAAGMIGTFYNTATSRAEMLARVDAYAPTIELSGGASYTAPGPRTFIMNCALTCTLTLPSPNFYQNGNEVITVINRSATGINVTIAANGGAGVNGSTYVMSVQGASVQLYPDFTNLDWRVIGNRIGAGSTNYYALFDSPHTITQSGSKLSNSASNLVSAATLLFGTDNTYDIGSSGDNRPQHVYVATDLTAPKIFNIGGGASYTSGSATPEGAVTAEPGSIYLRTNGSWYQKTTGSGNTGWTLFTSSGTGVTTLAGTANQITASAATGAVTLSLAGPHNFATATSNGVAYGNGTGALQFTAAGGAGTLCLVSTNGAAPVFGSCSGSAATAWDALTGPSANLSLSMGTNYTTFSWPTGTSTNNLFNLTSANSANGTGYILNVATGTSSTMKPLTVTAAGTTDGVEVTVAGVLQAKGAGGIIATTGDSATGFFPTGTVEAARGGTALDTSGSTGMPLITAGTWSVILTTGTGNAVRATSPSIATPTIAGGSITALTSFGIRSTGTGAFDLTLANTENLTAGRTLTLTLGDASRTLTMGGNITTAAAFATSGANSLTLTTTGSTNVTLPTTGTLAILGANTFTALQTINPGTTPQNAILLDINALSGADATRDSHDITLTGRSRISAVNHTPQWKQFVDVTTSAGISQYTFSYQFDGGGYTPLVVFKDDGTVSATAFEGSGTALTDLNATELTTGTVPYARMPLSVKSACTCDGSTDDASALQTLVNTMVTGDTLTFEGCLSIKLGTQITIGNGSGTYGGTSTATASTVNDISIEGHNVTVEWTGGSGGAFSINGPISRLRMRDISVDMNGNAGIAFDLNHARLSEFRNLYVLANANYGLRIRAYQVWTPGDGANGNSFDNIWISSTTAGAKGFDIGDTDTCNACGTHLDVAQNTFRNLRARFDTGGGSYVASSIGMRLNFTDAGQCDDCIFAAVTGLQITVPSGTLGASYPAGYLFNTTSLQASTASFAVTGTWTAVEKIGFNNYLIADGQTVPSDTNNNTYGTTSNGITWGLASDAGFISGLQLTWNSTSQIQIGTGVAQIQSNLQLLNVSSALTINPSLGASTWYYCYVYNNSGTPAGECVTTAPAAAYFGTARSKTGDSTRRYVGAIKSNGSSQIYTFFHNPETGLYQWLEDTTASPFRVLSGGTATTETSVDLTPVAPATARMVQLRAIDTDSTRNIFVRASTGGANAVTVRVNGDLIIPMTCTSAQLVYYLLNGAAVSGGAFLDVMGFYDLR